MHLDRYGMVIKMFCVNVCCWLLSSGVGTHRHRHRHRHRPRHRTYSMDTDIELDIDIDTDRDKCITMKIDKSIGSKNSRCRCVLTLKLILLVTICSCSAATRHMTLIFEIVVDDDIKLFVHVACCVLHGVVFSISVLPLLVIRSRWHGSSPQHKQKTREPEARQTQ